MPLVASSCQASTRPSTSPFGREIRLRSTTLGIFDATPEGLALYTRYRVRLLFRDKVMGGVPKQPDVISGWLRSKMGITDDQEIRRMTIQTLKELGADVTEGASDEDVVKASEALANKQANGFK